LNEMDEPAVAEGHESAGDVFRAVLIAWAVDARGRLPIRNSRPISGYLRAARREHLVGRVEHGERQARRVLPRHQHPAHRLERPGGPELARAVAFAANAANQGSGGVEQQELLLHAVENGEPAVREDRDVGHGSEPQSVFTADPLVRSQRCCLDRAGRYVYERVRQREDPGAVQLLHKPGQLPGPARLARAATRKDADRKEPYRAMLSHRLRFSSAYWVTFGKRGAGYRVVAPCMLPPRKLLRFRCRHSERSESTKSYPVSERLH